MHNNPFKKEFWNHLIDKKIGDSIELVAYFKQSLMATSILLVYLLIWSMLAPLKNELIFTAIASSTFLTFISTSIYDSLARKIIGGQLVGVIVGASLWYLLNYLQGYFPEYSKQLFILVMSLSAGFSLFFMAVLNFEHPPAAGTAMAFVIHRSSPVLQDYLFIIICACLLAATHIVLKRHHLIKDLEGKNSRHKKPGRFTRFNIRLNRSRQLTGREEPPV